MKLSRRQALAGLAGLGALMPAFSARAAPCSAIRRPTNLLLVYHPNGLEIGWQPTGTSTSFQLSPVLSALQPHLPDLLIMGGFQGGIQNEIKGHAQGMTSMWTGARIATDTAFSSHPSIDQLVAARIGAGLPFRSLELGIQSSGTPFTNEHGMIYAPGGVPVQPQDDPNGVYNRMFGSVAGDPAALERARREKKSVLDFALRRLPRIKASYPVEEQPKLDELHERIRDVERRLDGLASLTCEHAFDGSAVAAAGALTNNDNFPLLAKLQVDLLALAFRCGLTRVASLQYAFSTTLVRIAGVNPTVGLHAVNHAGTTAEKIAMNKWFVGQLAYVLQRLKDVKYEDGRTLLDETVVVWGTEMAVGNHLNAPTPFFIAGGDRECGPFKLGQFHDFTAEQPRHTRLLISVLRAMGIDDINQLGDMTGEESRGPLEKIERSA
jgi:hypothetical protein